MAMTKRILITGARAPVALELVRHFAGHGHHVYVADSVRCPLAGSSRYASGSFRLPSPRSDLAAFGAELMHIVKRYRIDMVIPTCEEVFYVAWHAPQLRPFCSVFCDDVAKLRSLHSKWQFLDLAKDCGLFLPESFRLTSAAEVAALPEPSQAYVFKPEFSRFASRTLIAPRGTQLEHMNPSPEVPWIAQRRLFGSEFCSYSVVDHGRIRAHVCYHPTYRIGLGAGVYFQPVHKPAIQQFVTRLAAKLAFHGQIGFDFIESQDGQIAVFECNPRATSGAHVFHVCDGLVDAFLEANGPLVTAEMNEPRMSALALCCSTSVQEVWRGGFRRLVHMGIRAKDICYAKGDSAPFWYQFVSLVEVVATSFAKGLDMKSATTADMEWNGEEML